MTKTNKNPSFKFEQLLWQKGYKQIVGLDEVGRGSFAGPLVAAAVILPRSFKINGIKDSKLLTPQKREILSKYIIENALFYSISEVSVEYINKFGVGMATHRAFLNCLKKLDQKFDFVLVDGFMIKSFDKNMQKGIIHGDRFSVSIAAASIVLLVPVKPTVQHLPPVGHHRRTRALACFVEILDIPSVVFTERVIAPVPTVLFK